jgi:hypothetical protein
MPPVGWFAEVGQRVAAAHHPGATMTEPSRHRQRPDRQRPAHPRVKANLLMLSVVLAIAALAVMSTFAGH